MKYLYERIPLFARVRLGLAYGWRNRKATWAMYSSVLRKARTDWEETDWRAELRSVMFSSGKSVFKDTSWKAMKKTGISKRRWKMLSAKDVPAERPDRWDAAARRRAISWAILPEAYLGRFARDRRDCMVGGYFDELVRDVREKSVEELKLRWALSKPDVNPEDLACLLFMGWCSATAWAEWQRRQSLGISTPAGSSGAFYDWGFGTEFYRKAVEIMRETDAFDAALGDRFLHAVSACARWYARPHCVTGMFSILEPPEERARIFGRARTAFGARAKSLVSHISSMFNPFAKSRSIRSREALALEDALWDIVASKKGGVK